MLVNLLLKGSVWDRLVKVVNRDMSIAVLRVFAAKRQEEHEESLLKKASRKKDSKSANGKVNGLDQEQGASVAEGDITNSVPSSTEAKAEDSPLESEENSEISPSVQTQESVAPVESAEESKIAKPLRVLEVLLLSNQKWSVFS